MLGFLQKIIIFTAVAVSGLFFDQTLFAQDISGEWLAEDGSKYTFALSDNTVEMKVPGSPTRSNLSFRGQFNPNGFEVAAKILSVDNINAVVPLSVRRQILPRHPNIQYTYRVRVLEPSKIELTQIGHNVTHDRQNLDYVTLNAYETKIILIRLEQKDEFELRFVEREGDSYVEIDEVIVLVPESVGTGTDEVWVEVVVPPDHPDFDDSMVEELEVKVTSDIDPEGEIAVCVETAPDSRIFRSQKAIEISITMGIEG